MIIILKLILILSIWVLGVKIVTAKDMFLQSVGDFGQRKVDEGYKIFEAIIVCPFCLPSIHSFFAYGIAFGMDILKFEFDWKLIIMWPIVVMGASIMSGFTWVGYQTINQIKEKNEIEVDYYKKLMYEIENNNDEGGEDSGAAISP